MKRFIVGICTLGLIVGGCGGQLDEAAQAMKNVQNIAQSAEGVQKSQDNLEKRRQDRIAKGDTLALSTDVLLEFVPATIDGYTAAEPEKTTMNQMGFSYAQVKKVFTKADGSTVTITLTDYNSAYGVLQGMSAMFMLQMSVENAQEKSSTFQSADGLSAGHESFNKQNKTATIQYAIVGRFLLQIEATNQTSVDFVKDMGNKIDQKTLASK